MTDVATGGAQVLSSRKLIEDYRETWEAVIRGSEPLTALDGYFNVPCFMVSNEGDLKLYASQEEIRSFNQSRLDAFRAGEAHNASLRAVDVQSQGDHVSLVTVNWELTRQDVSLERAWRHYYTVLASPDVQVPKIIVSAFQTGS
ncbi:hypothetical protein [Marimonas lutisalis]|uniref:hypothetical protein n=1 Tax=Marimonas lutisalis TaxID=2545756 RepID=UPI0010F59116|nr:hypothetical protein [Marimonas lutisalis]